MKRPKSHFYTNKHEISGESVETGDELIIPKNSIFIDEFLSSEEEKHKIELLPIICENSRLIGVSLFVGKNLVKQILAGEFLDSVFQKDRKIEYIRTDAGNYGRVIIHMRGTNICYVHIDFPAPSFSIRIKTNSFEQDGHLFWYIRSFNLTRISEEEYKTASMLLT